MAHSLRGVSGCVLLIITSHLLNFSTIADVATASAAKRNDVSLLEVEAEVEELRSLIAEQEKIVGLMKGQDCPPNNNVCLQKRVATAQRLHRRQIEREQDRVQNSPESMFKFVRTIPAPEGVHWRLLKFLPVQDRNDPTANYLLGIDNRGVIHILTHEGKVIASNETGHTAAITAFAMDTKTHSEVKVATGSEDGEVRIFTINSPQKSPRNQRNRPSKSNNETKSTSAESSLEQDDASRAKPSESSPDVAAAWIPSVKLTESWHPCRSSTIRGLSHRFNHAPLNGTDPVPITGLDLVVKGRSVNVLVGDGTGRVSLHLRNGSITSTYRVPGDGAVRSIYVFDNFAAICSSKGLFFMETKERRMLTNGCQSTGGTDDSLPDWDALPAHRTNASLASPANQSANASATGSGEAVRVGGGVSPRKRREGSVTYDGGIEAFAMDPIGKTSAFAAADDGRLLTLQLRGERSRMRCTVLHVTSLAAPSPAVDVTNSGAKGGVGGVGLGKGIQVTISKGFLYIGVHGPSSASSNWSMWNGPALLAMNLTTSSRLSPPDTAMHLPLLPSLSLLQMDSDKHGQLLLVSGEGEAGLFRGGFSFTPASEWDLSWLVFLRHPLILGSIGLLFMWKMKGKGDTPPTGPNLEDLPAPEGMGAGEWMQTLKALREDPSSLQRNHPSSSSSSSSTLNPRPAAGASSRSRGVTWGDDGDDS